MSKLGSVDDFSTYLTEEFNWRVKEISDVRRAADDQSRGYETGVRKAALALTYAHWEGYVKFSAEAYLKYISARKFRYDQLTSQFAAIEVPKIIRKAISDGSGVAAGITFIERMSGLMQETYRDSKTTYLPVEGNLNFERFCEVCSICGVDHRKILEDGTFLDSRVLAVRNKIAHGSSITVSSIELREAGDFVIDRLRAFRNEIELAVISKKFARLPAMA